MMKGIKEEKTKNNGLVGGFVSIAAVGYLINCMVMTGTFILYPQKKNTNICAKFQFLLWDKINQSCESRLENPFISPFDFIT